MEDNEIYTLAESTDEYFIQRGINKKKYFSTYIVCAKLAWKEIFKKSIYAVNSEWKTLKKGTPYNYIDKPKDATRVFSVTTTDDCNKIETLFYDSRINVISKPSTKKCSCTACDCSGLCEDIGSMVYTTKLIFTDNGTDYYEKKWVKSCANGDMIEYTETPTKKYNTFQGDTSPSDYDIVTVKSQKTVCKLAVKVCGCPENTTENIELLNDFCGCFLAVTACCKRKKCNDFLGVINDNHKGSVKVSECGNKFYYIPSKHQKTLPEFLLINYQTSGENCSSVVQVPDYAIETLFYGIDFFSKRFNNSYSQNEKDSAKFAFRNAQNELISDLNQLSLEWLSTVADAEIKW